MLVGAGGAGVAVGYGLLRAGRRARGRAGRRPRPRRRVRRPARQALRRRPGQRGRTDLARALADAAGPGQRDADRDARPPRDGGAGRRWCARDLWVSDVVYFPLETELVQLARAPGLPGACPAAGWPSSRRSARSSTSPAGRADAARMARALRGADRLMRKGIATVSLSGVLADKLDGRAAAGFDGVEIFDNDLVASPLSPREVAPAVRGPRARDRPLPAGPRRRGRPAGASSTPCCTGCASSST